MRRAYKVDLVDEQGYLMGEGSTIMQQEPTVWVYEKMEASDNVALAVVSDVVVKVDDFVVAKLATRAILRSDFEGAKERGELRFNKDPAVENPVKHKFTVAGTHKKLDEFILSLTDGERMLLQDKLLGGE